MPQMSDGDTFWKWSADAIFLDTYMPHMSDGDKFWKWFADVTFLDICHKCPMEISFETYEWSKDLGVRYNSHFKILFQYIFKIVVFKIQLPDKPNLTPWTNILYKTVKLPFYTLLTRFKLDFRHLLLPYTRHRNPRKCKFCLNCHCFLQFFFIEIFFAGSLYQKLQIYLHDLRWFSKKYFSPSTTQNILTYFLAYF